MSGRGDVCSQGERVHPVPEILHCSTFDDPDLNSVFNSLYFHLYLCHDSLLGLLETVWDVFYIYCFVVCVIEQAVLSPAPL